MSRGPPEHRRPQRLPSGVRMLGVHVAGLCPRCPRRALVDGSRLFLSVRRTLPAAASCPSSEVPAPGSRWADPLRWLGAGRAPALGEGVACP